MYPRVAVVDDRSVAFRGVTEVLRGASEVRFAGVFPTFADCAPDGDPTVVIADPCTGPALPPRLPGHLAVLVMSAADDPADVHAALGRGVAGWIGKGVEVSTLVRAVAAVACGDLYLDRQARAALAPGPYGPDAVVEPALRSVPALTPRECEVLTLIAEGLTHKQIGAQLGLSKATVDTYVHRVRQKTGTPNKAGLTRIAVDLQLTAASG
ncbi:DNA-binding response regulator, NarL/FixJ family, contains REC and HTH domains [Micromonospora nigra]|uniref:DNA-binding response regulator, NarL/FixJ family, contains REC and HTH domains n=1 Tax=Micromonospora nigra TaxID=145857 RepID=A0A1C6R9Q0_9ACTN|nr:response regulator transcription factor [Micromonospora nigra]SCL13846.1 DNA-binding response regulator, NarL/FixJ family, contains REC and HTH domains [Micromonospora nigra]